MFMGMSHGCSRFYGTLVRIATTLATSSVSSRRTDTFSYVDPVRNPYAPGAGQRPPELAGRDRELEVFDVVLERVARNRPERSLVLTGLRGVGKTVLLGELRSMAMRA